MTDDALKAFVDIGIGFKGPFSVGMDDPAIIPSWRKDPSSGYRPRLYNSATNALRGEAGGYAAIRVARNYQGVSSPVKNLDVVIVRECSEGIYVASEYTTQNHAAIALKVVTREASLRVATFAFDFARNQGRRRVTVVHKANVLKQADGMFVRAVQEVAGKYPDIELADVFIDAACAGIVQNPEAYDVMVMPNQYGDIMSDLSSALAGSIGLGGGATFGTRAALFEAVHGTAPDIAGKGIANPVSQIISAALMLRYLKQVGPAEAIESAVEKALADPANHTPDLNGKATTEALTQAIIDQLP